MTRLWSLLFLLVPILGVAAFAIAAMPGSRYWFPLDISEEGYVIDNLFYSIMFLTGFIFVATGGALFWFLWKYDSTQHANPVKFMHGSHTLEVVWSILPAATLVFIAVYQMNAWADAKLLRPKLPGFDGKLGTSDDVPKKPIAEVTGRQFEWRIRYAGEDGEVGTSDDIHTVNELHLPADEKIVLAIKSQDVLHNFFLPNVRVKNDVVPGMKQFVWFTPHHPDRDQYAPGEFHEYDIVCAELCGWGHYKMKGRLTIQSRADFDQWLAATHQEQLTTTVPAEEGSDE